jgi:hypothetical protein
MRSGSDCASAASDLDNPCILASVASVAGMAGGPTAVSEAVTSATGETPAAPDCRKQEQME